MMSAISAITPMEFGLIGLSTSTRTDRTTCIPHWRTRRCSRSFAMFTRMTSAITPEGFGLTASVRTTSAITPMEFGLIASARTMRIVLPMRSRTNPSTKPDPLEPGNKPMEDHSSLGRTACSCSEPRRIDLRTVGPDTRLVHPGRIRLPHRTKNFKLPQGTIDV